MFWFWYQDPIICSSSILYVPVTVLWYQWLPVEKCPELVDSAILVWTGSQHQEINEYPKQIPGIHCNYHGWSGLTDFLCPVLYTFQSLLKTDRNYRWDQDSNYQVTGHQSHGKLSNFCKYLILMLLIPYHWWCPGPSYFIKYTILRKTFYVKKYILLWSYNLGLRTNLILNDKRASNVL